MAYKLVIAPTAKRQLADIYLRHHHPEFKANLRLELRRFAENPVKYNRPGSERPRTWALIKISVAGVQLYIQMYYRFLEDEERLEITGFDSLSL